MSTAYWKLFIDAKTEEKTHRVFKRAIAELSDEPADVKIEAYHKGGFTAAFTIEPAGEKWANIVLESFAEAQKIGRSWMLSGDIHSEIDAWANDASIPGVSSIHLIVESDGGTV